MGDTTLACFGRIPWIDSQGARQAQRRQATCRDNDGGDGDNEDGEVEHDGGDDNDNNDYDDVNIDVIEDNDDEDGTRMMRWRRGRMDDDDAMAMGGQ
jgi:hypothetical protein